MKTVDIKRLMLKENYEKLKFLQDKDENKQVTVFDTVRGTIRVKNGVAYNKDFTATSRRIHLNGEGRANLVNKTVNYTVTTIPKKSFAFDLGGHRYELKNKRIPTHFIGPWSNIEVNNDLEQVLKAEFKQSDLFKKKQAKEDELKQQIKQEKQKLEEKYKNKLDEILSK
jgi:AsmA protein